MTKNYQKLTQNGQKRTKTDKNGQMRTKTDKNEQNGQNWQKLIIGSKYS